MWRLFPLFLLVSITFLSCGNDDDSNRAELQYDGDNVDAPLLPTGSYIAAARFTDAEQVGLEGKSLQEVDYFIQDMPQQAVVVIFQEGTPTTPGAVIYEKNVTSDTRANSWNTHELDDPIELTGGDIWIGIRVLHLEDKRSIGCDRGPALADGDWTFDFSTQNWSSLRFFTNQSLNINWNIRGQVE